LPIEKGGFFSYPVILRGLLLCHSEGALATEESPPFCHSNPFLVILSVLFCHSERQRRISYLFFYNRNEFLRFAQDDALGDLPPRNDKKVVILRLRRNRRIPSVVSCHSEARSAEESPQETLRAKALRVTNKKRGIGKKRNR
jgi:hypothetical protein